MSLKLLIIEDNPLQLSKICFFAEEQGYAVAGSTDNAEEGLRLLNALKPDLVLIDIQLSGNKLGIEVGHYAKQELDIPIIYLTSLIDPRIMQKAALTEPDAYLVKPMDKNSLKAAIEMIVYRNENLKADLAESATELGQISEELMRDSLFIKVGKMLKRVYYKEIVEIQSTQVNYVALKLENGQRYEVRKSLSAIENILPVHFCRIHRAHIVNCSYVDSIKSDFSVLTLQDKKIPIGTTYRKHMAGKVKYIA